MFPKTFVWGVAASAYQVEGTEVQDGRGECIWDVFCREGKCFEGQNADITCDHMHHYREDFALMRNLGIRAYRFSVSWARLIPEGTGRVNEKAVAMYRDMLLCMKENGITPYMTLYHWEFPQRLQERGGWLNPDVVEWFGKYAGVVAERFSDLCENFLTINEPECTVGLGYYQGIHAPGLKVSVKESFQIAHNLLKAHGRAVLQLRAHARQPVRIGYAPTCGVAYPMTDTPEDIEAAEKVYFGFYNPVSNWTWNEAWFADPVFLGTYPKEGLEKYAVYLPDITKEDMELIHQPLDFMAQNIYNGYCVRAGENGEPEFTDRAPGFPKTAVNWPVTPEALYYGIRFLTERYKLPLYISENGMSDLDIKGPDGKIHDNDRIHFLDAYMGAMQRAVNEGADVRGYFLWTFLDNFEWEKGYHERFGIVHVDFTTGKRTVKDSAFWYQQVIESYGESLSCNQPGKEILFLDPVCTHNIWGGTRLRTDFHYEVSGEDIGECWGISAHPNGDGTIKYGSFAGWKLSKVWKEHPELFGSLSYDRFPLLVKIIDARDDLSIQVHPDDTYAREHENGSFGKTECWYVLDCPEGASLVIGHHAETKKELEEMIAEGRWKELIREIPVHKGDFIQIDPGTVHAIKGGLLILETQQNSDITYRVYDYDRLSGGKPRQLHVRQSIDVITVPAKPVEESIQHTSQVKQDNVLHCLYTCSHYTVFYMKLRKRAQFKQSYPFLNITITDGDGILDGHPVKKGDHMILPCGYGEVSLQGDLELITSTVL